HISGFVEPHQGENNMSQRSLLKCLFVMLSFFLLAGQAYAACDKANDYEEEGGLSGWPTRVENSADATLRAAYANGTCKYIKGAHRGGSIPDGAPDDLHVTVRRNGVSCHVFKKSSTAQYYPTTCF
ncbi:MAG TPA: hypothetical protein VGZ01_14100, partial [Trinickia sp.]|nr:hypothetical protein [Trinickia sp.]